MTLNEYFIIGTVLIIVFFVIFIWRYKITDDERKRISERSAGTRINLIPTDEKITQLNKRKEIPDFFAFILILFISSFYFYKVFKNSAEFGFWGYFLIGALLIAGFDLINKFYKSEKKYLENLNELNKKNNITQNTTTSFDDFIAGRMSLAKCFWFYHVLIGFVLGFLCAYFAEVYQQYWLYIFPIAYYAVVTVAVWNCATLYANDRLENKQPYGWAIAAKIVIVLNAVGLIGQTIIMLSAK